MGVATMDFIDGLPLSLHCDSILVVIDKISQVHSLCSIKASVHGEQGSRGVCGYWFATDLGLG
jgi:hypothetical protein